MMLVGESRPHVMLLGAGASRAAFPNCEGSGKKLPLMNDLVGVLELGPILGKAGIEYSERNFEDLFSVIVTNPSQRDLTELIQNKVSCYFAALQLPEEPTLYDYLILSMTEDDVIATFNWDPFLIQAVRRNGHIAPPPRLLFLHGNVAQGFCRKDMVHGTAGARCSHCGEAFASVPLLYPAGNKNYQDEPAIASAWNAVRSAFENAFWVTIFGYSAPKTDVAAVTLLKDAWGGWQKRSLEQFEFIDIREDDEILPSWEGFVHPGQHHYDFHKSFFKSWIARHPRRSHQSYWRQYMEVEVIDDNLPPPFVTLSELWCWYRDLVDEEAEWKSTKP
jgi:hypothetical protein